MAGDGKGASWQTRIGTHVGGYRLDRLLGRGGMSVVYVAEQVHLGRSVALKLLAPELAVDETFRERFMRESRIAAALDHPNVIPIYDAGEADGYLFIAMRHVEGPDLGQLIARDGPMRLATTTFIVEQVASALDAAHQHGLIHRDVKPANILIHEPTERVFLTDFGVAKQTTAAGLTRTGLFLGTVTYSAPEQIEGRPLDGRTDLYALGCVAYECLTGSPPFARDAEVAVMHAHLLEPAPRPSTTRPELPRGVDDVITTAMAKAKEDRYDTCYDFFTALRQAALSRTLPHRPMFGADAEEPAAAVEGTRLAAAGAVPPTSVSPPAESPPPLAVDPTAGAPVAAQPTSQAPPSRPPRARGRRPPWKSIVIPLVVAALAAGGTAAAILLTRGHSSSSATPTTATTRGTSTAAMTESTATTTTDGGEMPATGLASLVPTPIWKTCHAVTPPRLGSKESASCDFHPPVEERRGRRELIDVYLFHNRPAVEAAYAAQQRQLAVPAGAPPCSPENAKGEGPWYHDPKTKTEIGGRYFCSTTAEGQPVIGWDSHQTYLLAVARCPCDHPALYSWWGFWVHQFRVPGMHMG
jgi:serine/threonine-protein kinase